MILVMGLLVQLNMRKSKIMIIIILQICQQVIAVTSQVSLRQTAHLDYEKTDDLSDIKAKLESAKVSKPNVPHLHMNLNRVLM